MARKQGPQRRELAQVRKTAGFTQEQFAKQLGVDFTTPSRWETGGSDPQPYLRVKMAKLLDITAAELHTLLWPEGVKKPRQGSDRSRAHRDTDDGRQQAANAIQTDPLPSSETTGLVLSSITSLTDFSELPDELAALLVANVALLGAITRGQPVPGGEQLHTDLDRLVDIMKRRGLLQFLGLAAGGVLASPAPGTGQLLGHLTLDLDDQERMAKAIASPSRVDEKVIGHSEAILWNAVLSDDKLGPHAALYTVLAQQHLLKTMAGDCSGNLKPRLLSVLSNAFRIAGWLAFNVEDFTSAGRYHEQARAAAHEADDTQISAFTLANMSQVAQWAGTPNIAVDHAVAAQVRAERTDNARLKAYASDMAACSYAAIGDYDTAMRRLAHTEDQLPACQEQTVSPFYSYGPGLHTARRGECLLNLGRPDEAIEIIGKSLTLYAPRYNQQHAHTSDIQEAHKLAIDPYIVRGVAMGNLELSQAYVLSGDIDQAAAILADVAELVAQNHTDRLIKKLHTTRSSMQPWQDTRAIRELDERLVESSIR